MAISSSCAHRKGSRTSGALLATLLWFGLPATAVWADPPGAVLAERIAEASGLNRWASVERVRFTWEHAPKSAARSYEWRPREGRVTVGIGGASHTVPTSPAEGWKPSDAERAAHEAFINDSYWLLFPLYLEWSQPAGLRDLGARPVPGMAGLGALRALEVTYGASGGYTPGDRYVLYVGEDFVPRAWAYHRSGSADPTLVTTREAYATRGELRLPTEFRDPTGALFIRITEIEVR